jgi:REP element-mobilizing transposase RayT
MFSYHAYLSWLPDRARGYVRRDEGVLPRDLDMADLYARNAKHDGVCLDEPLQRALIEEAMTACSKQGYRLHGAATDPSHVHLVVSWKSTKSWMQVRSGIKSSLSRRLNTERKSRAAQSDVGPSLSRGASRRHVCNRDHFDYLLTEYLPDHRGLQWYEDRGWVHGKG